MAQVTRQEDADRASRGDDDGDTTVTNAGDGPEVVAGPSGSDLAPKAATGRPAERREDRAAGGGFFTIYKKGQGYWTRMGTAIAAALIVGLAVHFLYQQLPIWLSRLFDNPADPAAARSTVTTITVLTCAAIALGGALLAWRLMNKPSHADFLIATDSEMKKVNWTSRKELIGSTRVVIFFMFLIAALLFLIDVLFGYFFYFITVLKTRPF